MPSLQVQARLDNARQTTRREADIVRGIIQDVRGRFGASAMEPSTGRGWPVPGAHGSLAKAPVAIAAGTVDNLIQHVQGFARINRNLLR